MDLIEAAIERAKLKDEELWEGCVNFECKDARQVSQAQHAMTVTWPAHARDAVVYDAGTMPLASWTEKIMGPAMTRTGTEGVSREKPS